MSTQQPLDEARDAIPNWRRFRDAELAASAARRAPHIEAGADHEHALVTDLADTLADGNPPPDDLDERATEVRTTAPRRRRDAITVLRATEHELHRRRDQALADGIHHALDVLRTHLDELITRARPALDALGTARTAEQAVENDAVTAWKTVRDAGQAYIELRRAHATLIDEAVAGTIRERDGGHTVPTWGERRLRPRAAVALFGHYRDDPTPAEHLPTDPVALLAHILGPDQPPLGVPDPTEIEARATGDAAINAEPAETRTPPIIVRPQHPYEPRPADAGPPPLMGGHA